MKVDLLKRLIKEAVSEAVREELNKVLSEDAKPKTTPIGVGGYGTPNTVTKYENYRPVVAKLVPTGDPIMDLLNETRGAMTQADYQGIVGGDSPMVDGGDYSQFRQGPEPGLDISQFDFVKKAGAIYNASKEKDKQRHGL
jgi:hypothetical protein